MHRISINFCWIPGFLAKWYGWSCCWLSYDRNSSSFMRYDVVGLSSDRLLCAQSSRRRLRILRWNSEQTIGCKCEDLIVCVYFLFFLRLYFVHLITHIRLLSLPNHLHRSLHRPWSYNLPAFELFPWTSLLYFSQAILNSPSSFQFQPSHFPPVLRPFLWTIFIRRRIPDPFSLDLCTFTDVPGRCMVSILQRSPRIYERKFG